jgi:type VI secretion system protein ImpC
VSPHESLQHKLDRVRRPTVRITYDVETMGAVNKRELPFIVGVLADLAGHPDPDAGPPPDLEGHRRHFVEIHRDNFNQVMTGIKPRLALRVPNELQKDGTSIAVELHFRSIQDFEPAHVARQVSPLNKLLEARRRLAEIRIKVQKEHRLDFTDADLEGRQDHRDPVSQLVEDLRNEIADPDDALPMLDDRIAALDQLLGDQLNAIMHDPEFQKLEASWRGLRYLMFESETGEMLRIRVLGISKDELLRDMERAGKFDHSGLFRMIDAAAYDAPYGVLIGDFEFGKHPQDTELLKRIAQVAAAAHAPFIAAASPGLFGLESYAELSVPRDLAQIFRAPEYAQWNSFRESEESRYVALCLPHILLRQPYGHATRPIEEFRFEEDVDGPDRKGYLWGNAAYALGARITDAFAAYGWCARIRGVEAGGLVRDLPHCSLTTDEGETAFKCSTEIRIGERHEYELARLGFIPLIPWYPAGDAVFFSVPSCHKPAQYMEASATAAAHLAAQLPYILTVSRFAHYLEAIVRRNCGTVMNPRDCEERLNQWIRNYVNPSPTMPVETKRRYPLAEAAINVEDDPHRPGYCRAIVWLRLHDMLGDGPSVPMRLVLELTAAAGRP